MNLNLLMLVDDEESAIEAEQAGVDCIFYDLEIINKRERQRGRNTVISNNSIENVGNIRKVIHKADLLVRINPMHSNTPVEIEKVIKDGADVIMLPMVMDTEDVESFIKLVNKRAKTVLLLETAQSLARLHDIVEIEGIDEIFIGLNDLHISLGLDFMFELLSGGIIEYMTGVIKAKNIPYGFGGIARIGEGDLPAELILGEHYRLNSSAVILSRTFKNAIKGQETLKGEIQKVRKVEKEIQGWSDHDFIKNKCRVGEKVTKVICNKKRSLS